ESSEAGIFLVLAEDAAKRIRDFTEGRACARALHDKPHDVRIAFRSVGEGTKRSIRFGRVSFSTPSRGPFLGASFEAGRNTKNFHGGTLGFLLKTVHANDFNPTFVDRFLIVIGRVQNLALDPAAFDALHRPAEALDFLA